MKIRLPLLPSAAFFGLVLLAPGAQAACRCQPCTCNPCACEAKADSKAEEGHPLRGVIVEVMAEKGALLVKHEEIPGVMKAMTMMLKVEPADLAKASKGQAVTGRLVRRADGWWLLAVQTGS